MFNIGDKELKEKAIIADGTYPFLFFCEDQNKDAYIVSCCRADDDATEWLIAETWPDRAILLLENNIPIREMFLNTELWKAVQKKGAATPTVMPVAFADLEQNELPTEGVKIDAEPDEFKDEIAWLRSSANRKRALRAGIPVVTKLPADWYDPEEDAIWEAYL